MRSILNRLRSDERGATAIEYGLLAALLAVGLIVALQALGGSITGALYDKVSNVLEE